MIWNIATISSAIIHYISFTAEIFEGIKGFFCVCVCVESVERSMELKTLIKTLISELHFCLTWFTTEPQPYRCIASQWTNSNNKALSPCQIAH